MNFINMFKYGSIMFVRLFINVWKVNNVGDMNKNRNFIGLFILFIIIVNIFDIKSFLSVFLFFGFVVW